MARVEVLRPYVQKVVAEYLELDPAKMVIDDDGDIPVSRGSASYYVRLLDADPGPIVQIYSPVLNEIQPTAELLAKINEINAAIWFGRMFHTGDQVVVATELVAETLDKEEIAAACNNIGSIADQHDTELHRAFGGKMARDDEPAPAPDGEKPADV